MDNKSIFNLIVCLVGVAILLIHIVDLAIKKYKRKDEVALLIFLSFTAFHFALYSLFTFLKVHYTSDTLIMSFYTIFYIFNNVQLLLFFFYTCAYVSINKKEKKIFTIINVVVFSVFVILDIVNIFNHMFFYSQDGIYTRNKFMIIAQSYQFVAFITVFLLTIFNKKLTIFEKISFALYCLLPLISIILQNIFAGYAIAYLALIIAIEILFLFVNVKKNELLALEAKKNKEIEVKLMMSQIQPHFVYNTLSSISTLIQIDQNKAQKALDEFTDYLRSNFSALTQTNLIPFEDELKHIQAYLYLEKMRFNERLNVHYDIKTNNFSVPPLSVQPIVENAVKHGIVQKIEGGNIYIKTYEDGKAYYALVEDDGVGFKQEEIDFKSNKHIGLANVYYRVKNMADGEMKIESNINEGTKVTIIFFK